MKNLIITADDFGVFPAINEGVFAAAEAGKLNSVEVFANFEGQQASAGKPKINSSVENAKELHRLFGTRVQIGCHLTITSGQPVKKDLMGFMCSGDNFRSYTELLFFHETKKLEALKNELRAQVNKLKHEAGVPVTHLTCHHNSLYLVEEYFHCYLEIAREFRIPIRSVNVQPERENNMYLKHIFRKLRDDMPREEREAVLRFRDLIRHCYEEHRDGVHAPDRVDSTHYGPVGFLPSMFVGVFKGLFAWNKNRQLKNILEAFAGGDEKHLELMLHIGNNENKHITEYVSGLYPGVAPNYFDSRAAELRSILQFEFEKFPHLGRNGWSAL